MGERGREGEREIGRGRERKRGGKVPAGYRGGAPGYGTICACIRKSYATRPKSPVVVKVGVRSGLMDVIDEGWTTAV